MNEFDDENEITKPAVPRPSARPTQKIVNELQVSTVLSSTSTESFAIADDPTVSLPSHQMTPVSRTHVDLPGDLPESTRDGRDKIGIPVEFSVPSFWEVDDPFHVQPSIIVMNDKTQKR